MEGPQNKLGSDICYEFMLLALVTQTEASVQFVSLMNLSLHIIGYLFPQVSMAIG